jgi:hypothetical protein
MGIGTRLQTERAETIQFRCDAKDLLGRALRSADLSSTVCLRFIDPFGDTIFNRQQAAVLIGELARLRPNVDDATRATVDWIITMAERVEREPHLYLKFEGD